MMLLLPSLDLCFSQDKFLEQGKDTMNLKNWGFLGGLLAYIVWNPVSVLYQLFHDYRRQSDNNELESNHPSSSLL